jgi:hypothetical protein
MELRLAKIGSPERKAELARAIRDLSKVCVGRHAMEKYVPRAETVRRQIEEGIEQVP